MNTKKTATTTNYSCYHFRKTGKIAKQRLSAMQHSDKKEFRTAFTNKSD